MKTIIGIPLTQHDGSIQPSESIKHYRNDYDRLVDAFVALHEQAHGPISVRFCAVEPCRSVNLDHDGPASHNPGMF